MASKFTVPEVLDLDSGRTIKAEEYFSGLTDRKIDEIHEKRRELSRARRNNKKHWVCNLCQERIYIKGGGGANKRKLHFSHPPSKKICPYQDIKNLSYDEVRRIKYNGAKESELHKKLKSQIAAILHSDPLVQEKPEVELTFFLEDEGRTWRRPDVFCVRGDQKLVFEVQISTDFVDVITSREDDYRSEGVYVFWIFNQFIPDSFTSRDTYVGNQRNLFVFNDRVQSLSIEKNTLILECHYKKSEIVEGDIVETWQVQDVALDDLIYDEDTKLAYYFPYDSVLECALKNKMREDFENYWCEQRPALDWDDRDYYDARFSQRLGVHISDIPEDIFQSKVELVIDLLYSFKAGVPVKSKQTLYGFTDTVLQYRKPFTFKVLLGIGAYGYKDEFNQREPFRKKYRAFVENRESKDYSPDMRYDALLFFLFPELEKRLKSIKFSND